MTRYKICLLPGDGIGPEVIDCAVQVLRALPLEWDFIEGGIGYAEYQRGWLTVAGRNSAKDSQCRCDFVWSSDHAAQYSELFFARCADAAIA